MDRQIEDQIRKFISEQLLFGDEGTSLADDASFLSSGVIDSMGVIELVNFVGQQFNIQVDPAEVVPENFDSIARLAHYIRRRRQAGPIPDSGGSSR